EPLPLPDVIARGELHDVDELSPGRRADLFSLDSMIETRDRYVELAELPFDLQAITLQLQKLRRESLAPDDLLSLESRDANRMGLRRARELLGFGLAFQLFEIGQGARG